MQCKSAGPLFVAVLMSGGPRSTWWSVGVDVAADVGQEHLLGGRDAGEALAEAVLGH